MANTIDIRLTGGNGGGSGGGGGGRSSGSSQPLRADQERFVALVNKIDEVYAHLASGAKTTSEAFAEIDKITKQNRDFLNQQLRELGVQKQGDEAQNYFAQRAAGRYSAGSGRLVAAPYTQTDDQKQAAKKTAEDEKARQAAEKADETAAKQSERDEADAERARLDKLRTVAQLAQNASSGNAGQMVQGGAGLAQMAGMGEMLGAGGAEALAMAAGPEVAAALALKEAAEALIRMPFQYAREGLEGIGNAAKQTFAGDGRGLFDSAVEGAAGAIEMIGPAGVILAEELRTAAKAVTVFGDMVDAAANRGKELARYNSSLGGAVAQQNVAQVRGDIEESRKLGPDYERAIQAQTEFQDAGRDIMLFLKGELLGALVEIAGPVSDFLKETKGIRKVLFGAVGTLSPLRILFSLIPPVLLLRVVNGILRWFPDSGKPEADNPLLQDLKDAAAGIQIGQFGPPEPPAQRAAQPGRPPLFPNV